MTNSNVKYIFVYIYIYEYMLLLLYIDYYYITEILLLFPMVINVHNHIEIKNYI